MRLAQKRMTQSHIQRLIGSGGESDTLDFKEQLHLGTKKEKYGFLKDVAAFFNSYGGYIVLGISDDSQQVGIMDSIDLATIHNVVESFFGYPFDIEYREHKLDDGKTYGLMYIPSRQDRVVVIPRCCNYSEANKTKNAMAEGDVYFRRGSRSIKAAERDFQFIYEKLGNADQRVLPAQKKSKGNSKEKEDIAVLSTFWAELSGDTYELTPLGQANVGMFLKRLTVDELKEAMQIAFSKPLKDDKARFKYFCGVAHNMADERSGNYQRIRLRQARAYFKNKPRGSGYFVDDEFLPYADKYDWPVLRMAIDETFSAPRSNYFGALLELLDDWDDEKSRASEILECRFCGGSGSEPPTINNECDPIPCRICNGKGVIAVVSDGDIVPCRTCGESGQHTESGYFMGDACPACDGIGRQSIVGALKVIT